MFSDLLTKTRILIIITNLRIKFTIVTKINMPLWNNMLAILLAKS